jgi:DNA mismatch repair protein MSH5
MNQTRTPLGQQLLKHWFFRPSLELPVIQNRLDAVAFLSRTEHHYLCDQLHSALKNIKNIPRLFAMMKKKPKISDWQSLMKFAYYSLKIRTHLSEYEGILTEYLASVSLLKAAGRWETLILG